MQNVFGCDNFICGHFADEKTVGQIKPAYGLRGRFPVVDKHAHANRRCNFRAPERLEFKVAENFGFELSPELVFGHDKTFFLIGVILMMNVNVDGNEYFLDVHDVCPHCHQSVSLQVLQAVKSPKLNECAVVLFCRHCNKLSFADLALVGKALGTDDTKLIALYPNPKELEIPAEIDLHYPQFYELYRQAHRAEEENLTEIVGSAYRKALEILVKNYLTEREPCDMQAILNESLGKSIARIEYPRIKALAKIAAWIGNDETRTVKKNPDLSVPDMKNFILALCHLILAEKVGDEAFRLTARK